jgi:YggT family protein
VFLPIFNLILNSLASILAGVLLLRFWMQAIYIRPPSPVAEFTFQLTDWLVLRLRRIIPGIGGYDWSSLVAAILLALLLATLEVGLGMRDFNPLLILIIGLHKLVNWICYGFLGVLLLGVIFSWVNPYAPLAPFVRALSDPLLRPIRRVLPAFGGIDFSSMVVWILLLVVMQVADGLVATLVGGMFALPR